MEFAVETAMMVEPSWSTEMVKGTHPEGGVAPRLDQPVARVAALVTARGPHFSNVLLARSIATSAPSPSWAIESQVVGVETAAQ